jgi:hypothetical protein
MRAANVAEKTSFNMLFALRRSSGLVLRSLGRLKAPTLTTHTFLRRALLSQCSLAAQKRRKTAGTLNEIKT